MKLYEAKIVYDAKPGIDYLFDNAKAVYDFARNNVYNDLDPTKEHFVVYALDRKNKLITYNVISTGSTSQCLVDMKQIFKFLFLSSASAFIATHNHPSGSVDPSSGDNRITRELREASNILSIEFLDHIIIGDDDQTVKYYSFREKGIV